MHQQYISRNIYYAMLLWYYLNIEFIWWFHEFSVTMNLRIFQETDFVYLFLCTHGPRMFGVCGFWLETTIIINSLTHPCYLLKKLWLIFMGMNQFFFEKKSKIADSKNWLFGPSVLQITTFICVEKIRRCIATEFVKLSDSFDRRKIFKKFQMQ